MQRAHAALLADELDAATDDETAALIALARAVERFSDLRALIELAYAEQNQLVALLTPPGADTDPAPTMSTAERVDAITTGVEDNRDRLRRLALLLADGARGVETQAQQLAAQAQQQGGAVPEEQTQALEAERHKFARAEQLRALADQELVALQAALGARAKAAPLAHASAGLEHIIELRKLFYSLIEHLKQLHADASETRDRTASAHQLDDLDRQEQLGPIAERQTEHADFGEAIAAAIEAQADQAIASAQDEQSKAAAERLQQAAPEVRAGATALSGAKGLVGEARDLSATVSVDLEPALAAQQTAIDHLAAALRILEPPKQDPQDQEDQEDQEDQKEQQEQEVSQQEAQRRLQQIREAEEERRKQQQPRAGGQAPVEKDW
jgi:hypothetical protein